MKKIEDILFVVQARMNSQRVPKKMTREFLLNEGEMPDIDSTTISNINTVVNNLSTISAKATVDEATALAIALGG